MKKETSSSQANYDDKAYALMQSALDLMSNGLWQQASLKLKNAALIHQQTGRVYDEARCLQLAATLSRASGELSKAENLVNRASTVASKNLPLSISIQCEQAEIAYAENRFEDAIKSWTDALKNSGEAGLGSDGFSAILRRRAATYILLEQIRESRQDYDAAFHILKTVFDTQTALWVRIEQASLLFQRGFVGEATNSINSLKTMLAKVQVDQHLTSEFFILCAKHACLSNQAKAGVAYAQDARQAALMAIAPLSYFKASTTLAEAFEQLGNRVDAYGTLATAWATLSDLLGKDVALSWIEPCLLGLKLRWGETNFRKAKAGYEANRKAATKREVGPVK